MSGIEADFFFAHPPTRVWHALTDSDALAAWLMDNDFAPVPGHEFEMRAEPQYGFDGRLSGKVILVDKPRRLVYTWRGAGLDTRLTWTLARAGRGTHVHLAHTGFAGARGLLARGIIARLWDRMVTGTFPEVLERLAARRPVTGR